MDSNQGLWIRVETIFVGKNTDQLGSKCDRHVLHALSGRAIIVVVVGLGLSCVIAMIIAVAIVAIPPDIDLVKDGSEDPATGVFHDSDCAIEGRARSRVRLHNHDDAIY